MTTCPLDESLVVAYPLMPHALGVLENLMQPNIKAVSAILVAQDRDFPLWRWLILQLHGLTLRGGHIGAEGHENAAGDTLLNRDLCAGVPAGADRGIDAQLRDPGQILHALGDLTGDSLCDDGFSAEG